MQSAKMSTQLYKFQSKVKPFQAYLEGLKPGKETMLPTSSIRSVLGTRYIMLGDITAWWALHHSQYTIPVFSELPIFAAYQQGQDSYERTTQGRLEVMTGEKENRVLTWDWGSERETLRREKGNWGYQRRFREAGAEVSIAAGSNDTDEWGEVEITLTEDSKSYERWRLSVQSRLYERFSLRGFTKRGLKASESVHFSGHLEVSSETYSESPSDSHSERIWQRGDLKGSEKTHQEGDFAYGESHVSSAAFTETKSWHRDSEHYWGVIQGKADTKVWSERWDIGQKAHFEERMQEDKGRKAGMRYERKGRDWSRQEWEGVETAEVQKKGDGGETAQMQQFLEEMRTIGLTDVLASEEVIRKLLKITPVSYSLDAEFLLDERQRLSSGTEADLSSLMQQIRAIHTLYGKQEALKGKMIADLGSSEANLGTLRGVLEEGLRKSSATLGLIDREDQKEAVQGSGKAKSDLEVCEAVAKCLLKQESTKFERLKVALSPQKPDQMGEIAAEIARLGTLQDSINTALHNLLPASTSVPSLIAPAGPELTTELEAKQALTASLVTLLEQSRSKLDEEGWEGFEEQGMDQGLAEVRSKLTSMLQPLEQSHPQLIGEVAALNSHSFTPQKLLSVVQLITQAVEATKGAAQPSLPTATVGLFSLFKPPAVLEEEYEETVEEVVEVTVDEQIQEMVLQVEVMEQRLSAQDGQIAALKKQLVTKERIAQALGEELTDLRRSAEVFEAREEELSNLSLALRQCKVALSDKALELQQLTAACSQLQTDAKRAKSLELKLATLERQHAALEGTLEALQHSALAPSTSTAQLTALRESAKASEQQIKEQKDCILRLTASNKEEQEKRNRQLLLRLVSAISVTLKTERTRVFLVWKVRSEAPISDWDYRDMRARPQLDREWSIGGEEIRAKGVSEAYMVLRKQCFEGNPLVARLDKGEVCTNSLMAQLEMYEFMEDLLDRKAVADSSALAQGQRPVPLPDFLVATVITKSEGNSHLTDDFLARFLSTLYAQYRLSTPMAVLYSRLLGLFHPFSVLLPASVLLLRFHARFTSLTKTHSLPQPHNMPLFCGPALPFPLLFTTFARELAADSASSLHFFTALQSAGEALCDLIRYYAKQDRKTENEYIQKQFKEAISEEDWMEVVGKWDFPKAVSREVFREMQRGEVVSREELAGRVKAVGAKFPDGLPVTKGQFLFAVLCGYEAALRQILTELADKLENSALEPSSEDTFCRAVLAIRPSLRPEVPGQLFAQAVQWAGDAGVTKSLFLGVLGLYGPEVNSPFLISTFPLTETAQTGSEGQAKSPLLPSSRLRSALKFQASRSPNPC